MIRIATCPKRFCAANKHRQKSSMKSFAASCVMSRHSSFTSSSSSSSSIPFSAVTRRTKPMFTYHISRSSSFHSTAFRSNPSFTPPSKKAAVSLADTLEPICSSPSPSLTSPHHSSLPPSSLPSYHHPNVTSWEDNLRAEDAAWLSGSRPLDWWTGSIPLPGHSCPGLLPDGTLTSLPLPRLASSTLTREQLVDYFDNTWALTEVLFAGLQGPEGFYQPPYHGLRHPLIFYYGHPAVLYVNKFRVAGLMDKPINAYFEALFETGVDEMSWDDMTKNSKAWPSVTEVREYRRQVHAAVRKVILTHPEFSTLATKVEDSPFWAVVMGCEHERIHLETSSVLFRELPLSRLAPPAQWPQPHPSTFSRSSPLSSPLPTTDFPANPFLPLPAQRVRLGKHKQGQGEREGERGGDAGGFGWDNAYGQKEMEVKACEVTRQKISNGEFYAFVKGGGYFDPSHWSQEGWKWRCFRNTRHPTFWVPIGPSGLQAFRLRTVFEQVDMPWSCPVEVNYHEASAYARWRSRQDEAAAAATDAAGGGGGEVQTTPSSLPSSPPPYRLLTEAEHHCLRASRDKGTGEGGTEGGTEIEDVVLSHSGAELRPIFNLNLAWGMASPVDAYPPNGKGFRDVRGNVWEWCEDHFSPLPGFEPHPHYMDFSLPCFDGEHQMIMGGSFASTGEEASLHARFHFRPHFFQHAGFRLVRPNKEDPSLLTSCMDNQGPYVGENPYRSSLPSSPPPSSSSSPSTAAAAVAPCPSSLPSQAQSDASYRANTQQYDQDTEWLQRYLHLHYPSSSSSSSSSFSSSLPSSFLDFPVRCATLLAEAAAATGGKTRKALDLGCAVGGSSFALARTYDHVDGLELSPAFVNAAQQLKEQGEMPYELKKEGETFLSCVARVPGGVDRQRVSFSVGDALALPADMKGTYDAVLLANVLCRLPNPRGALHLIAGRGGRREGGREGVLTPGGLLMLTTPFSWKEGFTPKERWLGGAAPEHLDSLSELKKEMEGMDYVLVREEEMPLVIRQHSRLYELIAAQATVWQGPR